MKMMMGRIKKTFLIGLPFLVICLLLIRFWWVERHNLLQTNDMEGRLKEAQRREEKAIVTRHVSKQMEEIAYQQKEISDKQRKEAELQAAENFRMKLRVEEEWKNAVTAQQEALEAYRLADKQKALAEDRQYQAEYAKSVADTLAYLTLGRSLGSLSITQYKTGNYEIASLLAYASWNFVKRYRGDVFLPSVFNALSLSAGQSSVWQKHKGGVSSIVLPIDSNMEDGFYTVGKYGEVLQWIGDGHGEYRMKTLLSDSQFDFRTACLGADGTFYALSYDGKLLKFSHGEYQQILLKGINYIQMIYLNGKYLLLSATGNIVSLEKEESLFTAPDIICMEKMDNCLCIGGKQGDIHQITLSGKEKNPVVNYHRVPVTAFGYCHKNGWLAIGYGDGTLLLLDSKQRIIQKLVGHRSAITGITLLENKLYSCSYDRTLRLWNLSTERVESVVVLENSSWLLTQKFCSDEEMILTGDENGNLYRLPVSPDKMAAHIKGNLPRNFTPGEWTYYMGNQIPYEVYIPNK